MSAADLRSITKIGPLVRARVLAPVDLVRQCLAQIEAGADGNAFITVMHDRALADAERAGREIAAGRYLGPLHGIPISVKDLIDVEGTPTTSGSALPARQPSSDADVVRRLRDAGAIVIGKTNLHEFAFGTTSDETAFGPVRHPKDAARSAGGSSGGSAAALAKGMCFGSVGTDTGGSVRIPAAACGIVGLKPTLGEISTAGVVPLSHTFDHVGPMARSVGDTGLLFQAMKGSSVQGVAPAGGRLVFGIPRRFFFDRLDPGARSSVEHAIVKIREAGYLVTDVDVEKAEWTPHVYLHIVLPEASCYHAPWLADHADAYSPGVRLRLEMGRYVLAEDYVRAQQLRLRLRSAVDRALDGCDALLLPGLPIPAPPLGAASVDVEGEPEPVRAAMLRLTQLFNLTGHPAIVLPSSQTASGLPLSIQLVGRHGGTGALLDCAEAVEAQIVGGPGSVGGGTG
jgi:aspartyl-tRNA(Asn)/glutamyl-tRNA(Gln) amidotransferase subunit A